MRLYVWEPKQHGTVTMAVMAENLVEAKKHIDKFIDEQVNGNSFDGLSKRDVVGWNTNDYRVHVLLEGKVFYNYND